MLAASISDVLLNNVLNNQVMLSDGIQWRVVVVYKSLITPKALRGLRPLRGRCIIIRHSSNKQRSATACSILFLVSTSSIPLVLVISDEDIPSMSLRFAFFFPIFYILYIIFIIGC